MLPFLVGTLGDERYGVWVIIGSIIGFYGLLDFGMSSAINRFLVRAIHSDNKDSVNIAITTAMVLFSGIGILSLLVTSVIVIIAPLFIEDSNNISIFQQTIFILGISLALTMPLSCYSGVLSSKNRFDIISRIALLSLMCKTALIVYFISQGYGIVVMAIITLITNLLSQLVIIYYAMKQIPEIKVQLSFFSKQKIKEYFHYGKYTYVAKIGGALRFSIDNLVVGAMIGSGVVTHYAISSALINYFGQTMTSIFGVIGPTLNKYHKLGQWDKLRGVFNAATVACAILASLIGGLIVTLGKPFIQMWMGSGYEDSYVVLTILAPAMVLAFSQRPSVSILYAIARHDFFAKLNILEAISNLFLSLVLVQYYGLYGVALGTAIPMIISKLIFQPVFVCGQINIPVKSYYFMLAKCLGTGVVYFSILYYIVYLFPPTGFINLFVIAVIASFIYVLICGRLFVDDVAKKYYFDMSPDKLKPALNWILR